MYEKICELITKLEIIDKNEKKHSSHEKKMLLKELNRALKGLKRADVFVSGGDKLSIEEIVKMQHIFNKVIVNGYGNNEVLGAAIVSPMYANKPGSIGIPMKDINIKIINPETNKEVKNGDIGELCLNCDNEFKEYLNNPEQTSEIKKVHSDGLEWVHSGDLSYIDDDGYVFLKGRTRRLIEKEAFKIYPATIEDVILSLSFVKECVVVGVKDDKSGNVPIAFIEFEKDLKDKKEEYLKIIEDLCIKQLPDYEIPSYLVEISNIPYTENNKYDFMSLENYGNKLVSERKIRKILKK